MNWLKITEILIPAIFSIFAIFYARYLEKQKEIENEIRKEKIKVYSEFTKLIFEEVVGKTAKKQSLDMKKLENFFPKFCNNLIFWGSDEVLKKYKEYFQALRKPDSFDGIYLLEDLLFAIRKDTGHKNKNLNKKDLLGIFINDIDEIK